MEEQLMFDFMSNPDKCKEESCCSNDQAESKCTECHCNSNEENN